MSTPILDVIQLLKEIRPQHGAVGSRDVDVTAQQKRIDAALAAFQAAPAPIMDADQQGGLCAAILKSMYASFQRGDSVERAHAAVMAIIAHEHAAPAHTESSQFANDETPRLAGGPAQGRIDTLDGALVESIEYWARSYATSMGGGHGMVVMLLREYASLVRAYIAQRAASDDTPVLDVELAAKAIYARFPGADAHPWQDGGNSDKQYEARDYARAAIESAAPAPSADEVENKFVLVPLVRLENLIGAVTAMNSERREPMADGKGGDQ